MNKPKPGTVQWIAPHLSERELKAIYEMVLDAIGENPPESEWWRYHNELLGEISAKDQARREVAKLFGMEGSDV